MQRGEIEIVYRLESASCLYFEGFSSDLQLPVRTTSVARVECRSGVFVAPRIPGREVRRVLGVEEGYASDAIPPCDYLDALAERDYVVELGSLLELRFISYTDPVTGMPVRCYAIVAKPGVVFEGVLRLSKKEFCGILDALREAASYGLVIGGLRAIGCGYVRLKSLSMSLEGASVKGVREVVEKGMELCRG